MKKLIALIAMCVSVTFGYAQSTPALREGKHNFTLQWISWDVPGKVTITHQSDDSYSVKGEQRNKQGDFVTIDGTLKVIDSKQLLFTGHIQSQYTGVNNGKPCDKQGTYHFLVKGARQYWRLQEMDNCEGNNVVDYIDIYFK